jgi:hypothetical protein
MADGKNMAKPVTIADRLSEIVKRSGQLAREMAATNDKMTVLTEQLAREAERSKQQASDARDRLHEQRRKEGS